MFHERKMTEVSHLPALFPVSGFLGFIRFDAADVMWSTFHQCAHQIIGLSLEEFKVKTKRDQNNLVNAIHAVPELSALH